MYSVIIVDDYEIFRNEIRSMPVWSEESGFLVVSEASNGQEALNKLKQRPVDILITDIRMPLFNGLELLKKATEDKLCSCIILMSQFSDFEYARQGLSDGAFEYLLKPIDPNELLRTLHRAAKYIDDRRQEISKISYLDAYLSKSSEEFFPGKELDQLVGLISEGSKEALESASNLVDVTYSEVNFDNMKTSLVLNRVLKRLLESIQTEYPWIGKLLNPQALKVTDFSNLENISQIKRVFREKVEAILSTIRKYELGIENSSMVRLACKTILDNIDTDININELASKLFITRTYLSQVFKEKTGITLVKYLTGVKIDRAKMLILSGTKAADISEILGYKDDEYFKKLFKKITGYTLNEFRGSNPG